MNIKELYKLYIKNPSICTDTRSVMKGAIFFALKGDNFDANKFAETALDKGCSYAIIDNEEYDISNRCILVKDTLETLQELAKHHRKQLNIPVIGITGTNGKTTTKELIRSVLNRKFKTFATEGNYNNHIGVPLSILSITKEHEIAIIEMGANHQHEIADLCEISQPTLGIITNIGKAHLEGFGSFENLINTKKELYDYIDKNNGKLFVNKDNKLLFKLSENSNKYIYGTSSSDSLGRFTQASPNMIMELVSKKGILYVKSHLIGAYNFENVLAAASIGRYYNIDDLEIKKAIEEYHPSNKRSQLQKTNSNTLILDLYNANPTSMKASIDNFRNIPFKEKTLILGDMLELGKESKREHEEIINLLEQYKFINVLLVGREFKKLQNNTEYKTFENSSILIEYLKYNKPNNNMILIKGSRGIKLEQCIEHL